jgi:hypothetical protein
MALSIFFAEPAYELDIIDRKREYGKNKMEGCYKKKIMFNATS